MKGALERWREIAETWWSGGFRTLSTAASVAWGIFILVVLLAAGKGLENNLRYQYRDDAMNSLWLYTGTTSKPYKGLGKGRRLQFDNRDYDWLGEQESVLQHTGRNGVGGIAMRNGPRVGSFSMRAAHPDHRYTENTEMISGRFINQLDIDQRRKVVVLGKPVVEFLFGARDPIGAQVEVLGSSWKVVGVFDDDGSSRETQMFYVPLSTGQVVFGEGEHIKQLMFTVPPETTAQEGERIEERMRASLGQRMRFDPSDASALRVRNNLVSFAEVQAVFVQVRAFTWAVGLGTLFAGVVGVSNIMLISVKERTRELGLRKALGATPSSLVRMILREAMGLTLLSGMLGLSMGLLLVSAVARWMPDNEYLRDPSVELGAVLIATGVMVLAGGLAGWFPARAAAMTSPVEALRA